MKKTEVLILLQTIKTFYPRFEYDPEITPNFWSEVMEGMDFKLVKKRLLEHVKVNKFYPTIAEIAAYPPKENAQLKKLQQLETDAQDVPQHIKDEFREALDELVRKKQR